MAAELNENHLRVRVPQGSVCYREFGTGAPLLFVHGLLVNGALWRKVCHDSPNITAVSYPTGLSVRTT